MQGKYTLRQFKTRIIEKLNQNQVRYTDFDDIKGQLLTHLVDLDRKKVDEFAKAAYGKPLSKLSVIETLVKPLEPWQSDLRCLRSLKNLGVTINKKGGKQAGKQSVSMNLTNQAKHPFALSSSKAQSKENGLDNLGHAMAQSSATERTMTIGMKKEVSSKSQDLFQSPSKL